MNELRIPGLLVSHRRPGFYFRVLEEGALRALRIPGLSPGWQASFRALLDAEPGSGNAGLAATSPPPAWPGLP